jgi:hypothetical protein
MMYELLQGGAIFLLGAGSLWCALLAWHIYNRQQ